MFCDYHVHTEYSDDSCYLMEDVIRDAIVLGIKEICFTDHVDYGIKLDWDDPNLIIKENEKTIANVNYPQYFQKIDSLTEKYYNQITIKKGMEFGIQMHTIDKFQNFLINIHLILLFFQFIKLKIKSFGLMIFKLD